MENLTWKITFYFLLIEVKLKIREKLELKYLESNKFVENLKQWHLESNKLVEKLEYWHLESNKLVENLNISI